MSAGEGLSDETFEVVVRHLGGDEYTVGGQFTAARPADDLGYDGEFGAPAYTPEGRFMPYHFVRPEFRLAEASELIGADPAQTADTAGALPDLENEELQ